MIRNPSTPEMRQVGQFFEWVWRPERVKIVISRIRVVNEDHRSAQIKVLVDRPGLAQQVYEGRARITDSTAKWGVARDCSKVVEDLPWHPMVETACTQTVAALLEGEPLVTLVDHEPGDIDKWMLYPFLHLNKPSIFFGLGGSMKSLLAKYIAVRVALGIECRRGNVLVLDWESDEDDWWSGIGWICKGMGVEFPPNIHYRFCEQRLADDIDEVKRLVEQNDISLVIFDSAGMAVLGEVVSPVATLAFFSSLRSLRRTTLIISHQNADDKTRKPFGNMMWENQARLSFQVKKIQEPGENISEVGLFQRKTNVTGNLAPVGYRVVYEAGERILIEPTSVEDVPEFEREVSDKKRVFNLLLDSGPMSAPDIAEDLGVKGGNVRSILRRLKDERKVQKVGNHWAVLAPEGTGA